MTSLSAPIDIFRAALPMIGGSVPSSLDDQNDEAFAFNSQYEMIVEEALCRHAWGFATTRATLAYQGTTSDNPAYQYSIPAGVLTIRKAFLSLAPFVAFELRGGAFLCDVSETTEIQILYNWRAGESDWPADFAMAIVYKVASALARGLLDRATQADNLDVTAERKFRAAMARDRQASGTVQAFKSPLGDRWRGTGTRGVNTVVAS